VRHIEAVIDGLAQLHASWYAREAELRMRPWIGHISSRESMVDMTPLWRALADHAEPYLAEWAGRSIVETQQALIDSVGHWWQAFESSPLTLIHSDFNPRNVALRREGDGLRLCAYDWELATLGLPQRDLVEFLCFVLHDNSSRDEVCRYVERHRVALEAATGCAIAQDDWQAGVHAGLAEVLINRLAFYVMIHRVRPQAFLPRIARTWQRLHALFKDDGAGA
jgi:aminoglycoside phosphotransferase (APT) family kinase protein